MEPGDTMPISVRKMLRESAVETGHVWVRGAASSGLLHVGAVRDSLLGRPRAWVRADRTPEVLSVFASGLTHPKFWLPIFGHTGFERGLAEAPDLEAPPACPERPSDGDDF
jgi:hypothetical protein